MLEQLPRRKQQIVELVARGYSDREIARELGIKVCTVKDHLVAIWDSYNLRHSRALLVARFASSGDSADGR